MQFPVSRYEFIKDQVVYFTVHCGDCYCSLHSRTGLTDEQAKKAFHREHNAEVLLLVVQKRQREGQLSKQQN